MLNDKIVPISPYGFRFPTETEMAIDETLKRRELQYRIDRLQHENERLKGEIKALAFAIRCNGVSGNEVKYENY